MRGLVAGPGGARGFLQRFKEEGRRLGRQEAQWSGCGVPARALREEMPARGHASARSSALAGPAVC